MDPITMSLFAMRAAGTAAIAFDFLDSKSTLEQGRATEKAQIEANLALAKSSIAEESSEAMMRLRQNIGSQIAIQAARGTASGQGSALFLQEEAKGEFQKGERARRMKLLAQQSQLRGADVLSGMELLKSETQLGRQAAGQLSKMLETFNTPGGTGFLNNK